MSLRGLLRHPRFNVVRGHRGRKEDVVMFDVSMHDSVLVCVCDATKQVKGYTFNERKREGSCPGFDERFHVAPVCRHHKAHVRAGRAFSGNCEFVQKLRAVRRSGRL